LAQVIPPWKSWCCGGEEKRFLPERESTGGSIVSLISLGIIHIACGITSDVGLRHEAKGGAYQLVFVAGDENPAI